MKLTHHIKNNSKPYKNLGLNMHGYQTPGREQNLNLTPTKWNNSVNLQAQYSARSTNSKICPYDNNLVYSQVNDRINEFSNMPYKNDDQKLSVTQNYDTNNDQFRQMKKEIRKINQRIDNSCLKFSISQIKQEIVREINLLIQQHRCQSAKSLRQAVIKIDQSTKRQCITQFSRQFLPLSYLDDSEKWHTQLENRIVCIQKSLERTKNIENIENQIRASKQIAQKSWSQYLKISQDLKSQKQAIKNQKQIIQKQIIDKESFSNCLQKKIVEQIHAQMEKQRQKLKQQFKTLNKMRLQKQNKLNKSNLQSSLKAIQIKQNPITQQNFDKKASFIQSNRLQNNKSLSFTFSLDSLTDLGSPQINYALNQSSSSIKDIKSSKYIIDNQNNLMDECGNYILDQIGKQIKLTEEQITMLRQSNVVKYKQE